MSASRSFNEKEPAAGRVPIFRCRRCPGLTNRLTGIAVQGGLICQACQKRRTTSVPDGPAAKRRKAVAAKKAKKVKKHADAR